MTRKVLVALAAVVLVSQAVLAEPDSLGDRILACAEEADDARRLACYDREALTPSRAGETVSTETEALPDVVAESAAPPVVVAEAAASPAAVTESATPPASDSAALDEFGMTPELARSKPEREEEPELSQISAKVVKVTKRPRGELTVTLDNGQTWTEKDAEYGFRVKVGDTIVIKKGGFSGAYRMVGRGRRASVMIRID